MLILDTACFASIISVARALEIAFIGFAFFCQLLLHLGHTTGLEKATKLLIPLA